jgi:hypothetical protein
MIRGAIVIYALSRLCHSGPGLLVHELLDACRVSFWIKVVVKPFIHSISLRFRIPEIKQEIGVSR